MSYVYYPRLISIFTHDIFNQRRTSSRFLVINIIVALLTVPKVLMYRDELLSLFRLLVDKTFSKRGFSWSGKLLSSTLLTLTHTYPLENKFVNPEEWDSEGGHQFCSLIVTNVLSPLL